MQILLGEAIPSGMLYFQIYRAIISHSEGYRRRDSLVSALVFHSDQPSKIP